MKEFFKRLFKKPTKEEIAEEYRIAKEANDEMLREKTVPEGFKLKGFKKVVKDGESTTTLTISSITGDIVPGGAISISGALPANVLSIDIPKPSPPGNFDGFNEVVAEMEAEDNPEETRYFLIKGLYCFMDPNLEPLEAILYDQDGNILCKRSIMEEDLILSFRVETIPEEGLDLVLKIMVPHEEQHVIRNEFPAREFKIEADLYQQEYDRVGKFPSNPETKRIVLNLSNEADYQEWVRNIKPMENFLESYYKDLDTDISSMQASISSINASAGGICSSALPASVAMPAPVSSAVSDTQITQSPGTFLDRLVQRGPKPAA